MYSFILASGLIFLFPIIGNTAALFGTVTDPNGNPLAFTKIYIEGTTHSITANENGNYRFELKTGVFQVAFASVGYEKLVKNISLSDQDVESNVSLQNENIHQPDTVAGSKDPAYAIIEKAIKNRQSNNEIESYTCKAYTKALQRITNAPDNIIGRSIDFENTLDSNHTGLIYLFESLSELSFKKPEQIKERVITFNMSGESRTLNWNRAENFHAFNFYRDHIKVKFLNDRVYVSPIGDKAMLHYRYKLLGSFEDKGKIINKISVTPRRPGDPAFNGVLYIVENSWNIHSLSLFLTKQNQMKYIDTLWIKQLYVPVKEDLWMWMSQLIEFNFSVLKVKAEGYYNIIYRDCDINADLSEEQFAAEIMSVEDEAYKQDSLYWKSNRPIILTEEEQRSYARKDSLEKIAGSSQNIPSLNNEVNRFTPWNVLLQYTYRNPQKKLTLKFLPYLLILQYNTVEGANLKLDVDIAKQLKRKKRILSLAPRVRYGFSNEHFNAMLSTRFDYNRKRLAFIGIDFGRYIFQFNRSEPISELNNSFHTLFIGRNYMKIFEEAFVKIRHRFEITNGFMLWSDISYARRLPLRNTSSASIKEEKIFFSPNITFEEHDAFVLSFKLQWQPGQKYISMPNEKIIIGSKYPRLALTYRKSIPDVFKSRLNYDFLQFKIAHDIGCGLFGNMHYSVSVGTFLNHNATEFMDIKHFDGNKTVLGSHILDGFQILDYYVASTTDNFIEVQFYHQFDGFLFNKIPYVRKAKLQLVFGTKFLYTPDYKDYTELDIGIENILRVLRMDFAISLSAHQPTNIGFRIGVDFGEL